MDASPSRGARTAAFRTISENNCSETSVAARSRMSPAWQAPSSSCPRLGVARRLAISTTTATSTLSSATMADLFDDNDGDIDVGVGNDGGPVRLLINNIGNHNHWLGM